ncbi:MAG: SPFH/Band 7/PHB domain protein [Erysipelotrichaceae bacterium]|nr:SPFH/Band 7/PHB domain protein [Erysipelotrichaceae bacterium]MBR3693273.1 SPFH/Band 7/PHB domain protein [Erysipelotrichales bacterium]
MITLGQIIGTVFVVLFIVLALGVAVSCVKIVPQSQALVIEKLGAYSRTLHTGVHFLVPIIETVRMKVNIKEQVADFQPQPVITRDNVTLHIDSVVYFYITDPKLYTYGIERPMRALELMSATSLRNMIGELELDQTLTSRETINSRMRQILDEVTDPWGIKVTRVEIKNIIPPKDLQEAMEKQMRAERERRETILQAEGKKKAAILEAEGEKEAAILRAEAKKEQMIREAEGKAQALERIYLAEAKGIQMINESKPSPAYLALESYKALEKVANGNATKMIVPTDIANVAGTLSALTTTIEAASDKNGVSE